jgi:hypothetical protein
LLHGRAIGVRGEARKVGLGGMARGDARTAEAGACSGASWMTRSRPKTASRTRCWRSRRDTDGRFGRLGSRERKIARPHALRRFYGFSITTILRSPRRGCP